MLILGREVGQSVIIGDAVKVSILQTESKLQLVIQAPKDVRISKAKQIQEFQIKYKNGVRKIGKTVLIGDLIKVTLLQTESGLLRYAIDAPKEINIFREELFDRNRISKNKKVVNL